MKKSQFNFTLKKLGIRVREGSVSNKALAHFNSKTNEIVINPNLRKVEKHICFIHEVIHAVDHQLIALGRKKRSMSHWDVTNLSPNILIMLVLAGFYTGVSKREIIKEFSKKNPRLNKPFFPHPKKVRVPFNEQYDYLACPSCNGKVLKNSQYEK